MYNIWLTTMQYERALNNINVFNSFKTDSDMKLYLQIEITRKATYIELLRLFIDDM